ncbi:hypothetical protein Tco_0060927 [Tanacetum coccineum]
MHIRNDPSFFLTKFDNLELNGDEIGSYKARFLSESFVVDRQLLFISDGDKSIQGARATGAAVRRGLLDGNMCQKDGDILKQITSGTWCTIYANYDVIKYPFLQALGRRERMVVVVTVVVVIVIAVVVVVICSCRPGSKQSLVCGAMLLAVRHVGYTRPYMVEITLGIRERFSPSYRVLVIVPTKCFNPLSINSVAISITSPAWEILLSQLCQLLEALVGVVGYFSGALYCVGSSTPSRTMVVLSLSNNKQLGITRDPSAYVGHGVVVMDIGVSSLALDVPQPGIPNRSTVVGDGGPSGPRYVIGDGGSEK